MYQKLFTLVFLVNWNNELLKFDCFTIKLNERYKKSVAVNIVRVSYWGQNKKMDLLITVRH